MKNLSIFYLFSLLSFVLLAVFINSIKEGCLKDALPSTLLSQSVIYAPFSFMST